ncbi:MAG: restriction endonuclease [Dokdonella sp.]
MAHKRNRKRWDDWLSRLEPTRFESLLAEYFREQGYRVDHVGAEASRQRYDGGIDLKLYKDDAYIVVQCKNWNANLVPHNPVHELLGVMLTQRASGAMVVTSGEFTAHAITSAAEDRRMRLIDGVELRRLLATWPGRARWSLTRTGIFPGFAGASRRMLVGSGVAVMLVAALVTALVSSRNPDSRRSPAQPSVTMAASANDPANPIDGGHASSAPAQARESPAPASSQPESQTQGSRPTASYADRRRAARTGMQTVGRGAQRAAASAMGAPDVYRTIDPESARLAVSRIAGVRSAVWMDKTNFIVRVDSAELRSMAMINEVCDALEPLGDTLGVVVALQNANARNGDEMETLTRNCQLGEGQRAFGQRKRQIDTISPEVRAQFKAMQERNQPKR